MSRSPVCTDRIPGGIWAVLVVLLMGLSSVISPGQTPVAPGEGPVNTQCPVTPGETVDPRFTVMFKGVEIGLCCRKCEAKFNENPETYFAALMSVSQPAEPGADGHSEAEDHAHDDAHDAPAVGSASPAQHDHAADYATEGPRLVS